MCLSKNNFAAYTSMDCAVVVDDCVSLWHLISTLISQCASSVLSMQKCDIITVTANGFLQWIEHREIDRFAWRAWNDKRNGQWPCTCNTITLLQCFPIASLRFAISRSVSALHAIYHFLLWVKKRINKKGQQQKKRWKKSSIFFSRVRVAIFSYFAHVSSRMAKRKITSTTSTTK